MADINVERRKSSPLMWVLLVLLILALAFLAWTLLRGDDDVADTAPAVQVDSATP